MHGRTQRVKSDRELLKDCQITLEHHEASGCAHTCGVQSSPSACRHLSTWGGGAYCLLRCYKIHGHFSKTHCFTQTVKLVFSSVIKKKQKTKTKQQYYIIHFPLQKQSNVIHCLLPARHFTVFYINTYEDHKQSTAHQWCMQRIMQVSKRSNTFNGLALRNHHMKTFYLIGWICWFTTENLQNWWHSHQPRLYIVPNAHQQMLTWLCKMAQVLYLLNIITMCLKALLYSLTEQFP